MKKITLDRIVSILLFFSAMVLFFMSFVDYHAGLGMFQLSNPLVDEDWILTLFSLVCLVISLKYVASSLKKLSYRK